MNLSTRLAKGLIWISALSAVVLGQLIVLFGLYVHLGTQISLKDNSLLTGIYLTGILTLLLGIMGLMAVMTIKSQFLQFYLMGIITVFLIDCFAIFLSSVQSNDGGTSRLWIELGGNGQAVMQRCFGCCGFDGNIPDYVGTCEYPEYCSSRISGFIVKHWNFVGGLPPLILVIELFNAIAVAFVLGQKKTCCVKVEL